MPKKKNFLGGMQNYNAETGEYESALVGANGERPTSFKSFKKEKSESSNDKGVGKISKYSPYKNMGDGTFKKDDDNQVRVKTLHNGLAMETKAQAKGHYYHDTVGRYKLVDVETGTMVGWAKDFEDAVKKSQDQDFVGAINRAKETFFNRHPDLKPEVQKANKEFNDEIKNTAADIQKNGDRYTYMMLDRLRSDVEYTFGNGKGATGHLWYDGNPEKHVALMKELYKGLKDKPEWLTMDKIEEYEQKFKEMKKED